MPLPTQPKGDQHGRASPPPGRRHSPQRTDLAEPGPRGPGGQTRCSGACPVGLVSGPISPSSPLRPLRPPRRGEEVNRHKHGPPPGLPATGPLDTAQPTQTQEEQSAVSRLRAGAAGSRLPAPAGCSALQAPWRPLHRAHPLSRHARSTQRRLVPGALTVPGQGTANLQELLRALRPRVSSTQARRCRGLACWAGAASESQGPADPAALWMEARSQCPLPPSSQAGAGSPGASAGVSAEQPPHRPDRPRCRELEEATLALWDPR